MAALSKQVVVDLLIDLLNCQLASVSTLVAVTFLDVLLSLIRRVLGTRVMLL